MSIKSSLGRQFGTQFDTVFDVVKSNPAYDKAGGSIPSLDLNFASTKSLYDSRSAKNLITFTRPSGGNIKATYVGSDGSIKTSPVNLLEYSVDVTNWSDPGGSSPIITLNATTAPDGSLTGVSIRNTGFNAFLGDSTSFTAGNTYTFSGHFKADDGDQVIILLYSSGGLSGYWNSETSNITRQFDLTNGTSTSTGTDPTSWDITPVGNGWYRCSITATCTTTHTNPHQPIRNVSGSTEAIFAWGMQIEEGTAATTYIPTNGVASGAPRFDHDPVTGECLGLLIEEARTNLIDNSSGSTMTPLTVTKQTVSELNPEGVSSCLKITADSSSSANGVRVALPGTSSANNTTVSAFVKKDTYRYVQIGFGGLSNSYTALFDIEPNLTSNRLLGQGGKGTYTNIDAGYTDYQNGWIRIWASGTTIGTDGPTIALSPDNVSYSINNWTPVGTEAVLLYGIQYEDNAAFPTSYIPTSGSTVTRSADVAEITGTNFSSWYNQSEGTVFASIVGMPITSGQFPRIFELSDGTSNNVVRSQQYGNNTVRNNVFSGGTNYMALDGETIAQGSKGKTVFAVAENNCAIVTNGGTPAVDTTVTMPTNLDRLGIFGTTGGTSIANSTISRLTYWPTRLSDSNLQSLTS